MVISSKGINSAMTSEDVITFPKAKTTTLVWSCGGQRDVTKMFHNGQGQ